MRFRFDPLSRAFSNGCVFDENAQRISLDGRPKGMEMCAFSKTIKSKNGLTIRPESRLFGFLWVRLGIAERSERGRESLLPGLLPTASFELH